MKTLKKYKKKQEQNVYECLDFEVSREGERKVKTVVKTTENWAVDERER